MKGMGFVLYERRFGVERGLRESERMVSQDAPVVVDDQELEPSPQHSLAVGEEPHNGAAEPGSRGRTKSNALATGLLSGRREGEPRERGVSARALMTERV